MKANHQYRPDIDGLRAVAILSVLMFHAAPSLLPGGFIGVDIFFVISGYLISGIVIKELAGGTFSIVDFYIRRVRRIFPALSVVLLSVLAVGWYSLLSDEFAAIGAHVAAGATFVSNILLWKEAGYFDPAAELKPLLHLWSLGIEEQFYLFWPLLLAFCWRRKVNLAIPIVVIGIASFGLNLYKISSSPTGTFYLPVTRLWELLAGTALAYLQASRILTPAPTATRASNACALTGAALIVTGFTVLNESVLFPGWAALLPTGGAALLIAAGPAAWVNRHVLSASVMVSVGLISYPLYVWHWPLLSFAAILEGQRPSPAVSACCVALAFVLAHLTYRFIETPVRKSRFRRALPAGLCAAVAAAGIIGYACWTHALVSRSDGYDLERIVIASTGNAIKELDSIVDTPLGPLQQASGSPPPTVMLLGDSNAQQYYPRVAGIRSSYPDHARSVIVAADGGCAPMPFVHEEHHPDCGNLLDRAMAFAEGRPELKTVVIAANWMHYFENNVDREFHYYIEQSGRDISINHNAAGMEAALSGLGDVIRELIRSGKEVYVVLQIPSDPAVSPRRLIQRSITGVSFAVSAVPLDRASVDRRVGAIDARVRAVAAEAGAKIIDPLDALCTERQCDVITADGLPVYRDMGHLNPEFVRDRVHYLDSILLDDPSVAASPRSRAS